MRPTLYAPPEDLTEYVECFWTLEACDEDIGVTLSTFAHGASGIIFQHCDGRSGLGPPLARAHPFRNRDLPTSFLYGKRTAPSHTFAKARFGLMGVVLRPQALSTLLNIRPAELTNAPIALADLSSENVGERLLNASSQQEQLVLLGEFVRARIGRARREDPVVTASLQLIDRRIRSIRVQQVLKYLNVSERQFERRFMHATGVSPHQYIRIVRFQEVVRRLKTMQFDRLSDVAYDLNYTDQSHFIKEVKALSGYVPTRLFEIVRTCVDFPSGLIQARAASDGNLFREAPQGNAVRQAV